MLSGTLPLIIPVILAIFGATVAYLNNLSLSRRKERLELINKRINDFYGPLYVASKAGQIAFDAVKHKLGRDKILDSDRPLTESELAEWRIWVVNIFSPLNDLREEIILKNAHLIREEEIPECLLRFVTHVSAYKAILYKWEQGDFSEYQPIILFPSEITEYAEKSYRELKEEQLELIGKLGQDS
jgi:hypothetical protein